jgi:hypothetical protein
MESGGKFHRGVKPLLHSGEEYRNDLNHNCIPFHPRRCWAWAFSWLDNLGEMVMNLARQSVKAWPRHPLATRQQTNALRRGYIKARMWLGDKWLLAVPVKRKEEHQTFRPCV